MSIEISFGNNDSNSIFVSRRLAIGVAILIFFLLHFTAQFLAYFPSSQLVHKHKIDNLSKRLYLYTIASLLAYNYFQGGVFEALLAWFTLIIVVVLHISVLKCYHKPELENKFWICYYVMILIYFLGIIIRFYSY